VALSPEQAAALALAYQQAMSEVRDRVTAAVEASWLALSSWRDEDIAAFVRAVLPVVLGGQQAMAGLVSAYLADSRSAALDVPPRPVGVRLDRVTGAAARNGTPPGVVYRRAGEQVWRDLGAGKPLDEAVRHGLDRATKAAQTDLQRTKTLAAREVIRDDGEVVGHRRVLVGPENCALCVVASTQRYHKADLLPIHPGCNCEPRPMYGRSDPGQVIDEETLAAAHEAIMSTFGVSDAAARNPDYRKLILVRDHSELGPLLTVKKHRFSGPEVVKSKLDLSGIPGGR
jgi:hypothetical protein